jgi:6-phospho-beta-glucosidase
MKLAVVGGGSTYTPELVDGFARLRSTLPIEELVLTDPAADRLALVEGLARRMFARAGHPGTVRATSSLVDAVEGADAVLLQLRVGGQAARRVDETLPLQCGCIGQETTGWGGLAKALRTVPVVLDIADVIAKHAKPDAWIIDFTNPVGIVTRALLDAGHRAVGLCNVAIGFQRRIAERAGVDPRQVRLGHAGLNHLTWIRSVLVDGQERLPELLAGEYADELSGATGMPADLMRRLGFLPSYYLRYYYAHDEVLAEQCAEPSRAEQVAAIESELLDLYADSTLDTKPALLEKRGGAFYSEAAVQLLASLAGDTGDVQVVNLRNNGTLPFLADEAVVEVPALIGSGGPRALPVPAFSPLISGLISHVSAYEELALDAALHGGRDRVFAALLAHPLVGQTATAGKLTDLLLDANREHLRWLA